MHQFIYIQDPETKITEEFSFRIPQNGLPFLDMLEKLKKQNKNNWIIVKAFIAENSDSDLVAEYRNKYCISA